MDIGGESGALVAEVVKKSKLIIITVLGGMMKCFKCEGEMEVLRDLPYHYTESGLNNVYLHGVVQYRCLSCGEMWSEIPKIKALHLFIARTIICKQAALVGDEVRFLRKELAMKGKEMAEALVIEPETFSRWENGKQAVAPYHDRQLRLIYILNASEKEGRILHHNIRKMLSKMATLPPSSTKIDIAPQEWMLEASEPAFSDSCLKWNKRNYSSKDHVS